MDYNNIIKKLNKHLEEENADKAIELLEEFTKEIQEQETNKNILKEISDFIYDWSESVDELYYSLSYYLGIINFKLGNYEEAIHNFSDSLNNENFNPIIFIYRGHCYHELDEIKKAIIDYSSAIECEYSDNSVFYYRGAAYIKLEYYKEAYSDFSKILEHENNNAEFYASRGYASCNLRNFKDAIVDYNKAIKLESNDPLIYFDRGNAYLENEEYKKAISDYKTSIKRGIIDISIFSQLGQAYICIEEYNNAIEKFTEAIKLGFQDSICYFRRSWAKFNLEDYYGAINDCNQALLFDESSNIYSVRGDCYLKLEKYENALTDYNNAIRIESKNDELLTIRGKIYSILNMQESAIKDFDDAIIINPENWENYYQKGICLYEKKDLIESIKSFTKALEKEEQNFIYQQRALNYYDLEKFENALDDFKKVKERDYEYYYVVGLTLLNLKKYNEAIESFKTSSKIDSSKSASLHYIGMCHFFNYEYDNSISYFSKSLKDEELKARSHFYRGVVQMIKKDFTKGIEDFTYAIKQDPDYYSALYYRALCHSQNDDKSSIQKAKTDLLNILKIEDNRDELIFNRAKYLLEKIEKQEHDLYRNINSIINKIMTILRFEGEYLCHYSSMSSSKILIFSDNKPYRISDTSYLNDTSEGKTLFNLLSLNEKIDRSIIAKFPNNSFIGSFVPHDKCDDLTMWRMYGKENEKEAQGCSIVINIKKLLSDKNDQLNENLRSDNEHLSSQIYDMLDLFSVAYINKEKKIFIPNNPTNQTKLNDLVNDLNKEVSKINWTEISKKETYNILELLSSISYLFKSAEYQYEHEVRLIVPHKDFLTSEIDSNRTPPLVYFDLLSIKPYIKTITLGPKVERSEEWITAFQSELNKEEQIVEFNISDQPYK